MILVHPRKLVRRFLHSYNCWLFAFSCKRKGVSVSIGNNCILNRCFIKSGGGSKVIIEDNCSLDCCRFHFYGEGGRIIIRQGTTINARQGALCMFVRGETSIEVGKNCLIAHSVEMSTTDFHSVLDSDGEVMNADSSIVIGNHVWIGKRVTINKGVKISDGSIVGASSVVTKEFLTSNILIAGNPAVMKKQSVVWTR